MARIFEKNLCFLTNYADLGFFIGRLKTEDSVWGVENRGLAGKLVK
jgi:hypothetical protein